MSSVVGWLVDEEQRPDLLRRFPAVYPDVVAHHVTLRSKAPPDAALPDETAGEIIGEADDGNGVQALVVRIGGTTDRPGGGTFHITWSLDKARERRAVESNQVIARQGWTACEAVPVKLRPARF